MESADVALWHPGFDLFVATQNFWKRKKNFASQSSEALIKEGSKGLDWNKVTRGTSPSLDI